MSALASPSPAYAFAASPCGGLRTRLNGAPVTLRASGALWLEEQRTLVVADLHLEKGSAYAMRGQMLPPYDTRDTLRRLQAEVVAAQPAAVVLLGDTFHDRASEDRLARDDAEGLRALSGQTRLVWVVGNHDADGPRALPGEVVPELTVESLVLRHEPAPGRSVGEVAGHLHPCLRVAAAGTSVRRRCFVTDGSRLVAPAFGAYAGGLSVRHEAFSTLFADAPVCAALSGNRVRAIGWRSIRPD